MHICPANHWTARDPGGRLPLVMRPGGRFCGAQLRLSGAAAVAALTVSVALLPGVAASRTSRTKRHIPNCKKLPRSKMADIAQTGRLTFRKKIGNLCEFTGHHPNHYEPTFDITVVSYKKSIWDSAKSQAQSTAAMEGSDYGDVSRSMFFVQGNLTDKGDAPCNKHNGKPGKGGSKFGPACIPEPDAVHIGVYGHGTDKHNGLHLMVSAAVTAQKGDVHLSHMIKLVKDVISGKIR